MSCWFKGQVAGPVIVVTLESIRIMPPVSTYGPERKYYRPVIGVVDVTLASIRIMPKVSTHWTFGVMMSRERGTHPDRPQKGGLDHCLRSFWAAYIHNRLHIPLTPNQRDSIMSKKSKETRPSLHKNWFLTFNQYDGGSPWPRHTCSVNFLPPRDKTPNP
jgi:hypothetical protein